MATRRCTTYKLSVNDDQQTLVKKINSFMRSVNQDVNVTNITKQGGVSAHQELTGTRLPGCHPPEAIDGLEGAYKNIDVLFAVLDMRVDAEGL